MYIRNFGCIVKIRIIIFYNYFYYNLEVECLVESYGF